MVEGPGVTLNGEKIRAKVQKGQKIKEIKGSLTTSTVSHVMSLYALSVLSSFDHGCIKRGFYTIVNRQCMLNHVANHMSLYRNITPEEMPSRGFMVVRTPGLKRSARSSSCTSVQKLWGNVNCISVHTSYWDLLLTLQRKYCTIKHNFIKIATSAIYKSQ